MFLKFFNKLKACYGRNWWLTPLTIFIIWRILLELAGHFAFALHPDLIIPWRNSPNPPLWARWDSGWYDSIMRYGYSLRGPGVMSNVTFFPLFPLLAKFVETITPLKGFTAALFTANLLCLSGFLVFYRWAEDKWNKSIAIKSLLAIATFPTSFFFISAYSESTLFLLISLALLFSSRRQWIFAAIAAMLASAARPTGIFLWPLVAWLWWSYYSKKPKPIRELFAILLVPPLGLLLFSLHLYFQTGHPFVWLSGQAAAGRGLVSPLNLLWAYSKNIFLRQDYWLRHVAEMAALLFTVILLPKLKKIHPAYAFYAFINLLPSLFSNTLTSIQRFVLIIAPLFAAVALEKKYIYIAYCVTSSILLLVSIYLFVAFQWAG